ncbi:MAG: DEAD/DEAH box helicase [Caulobacterales bacterium]|nr:DEAD/DEAH box helicase [Caulobacterales bacterium]
MTEFTKLGLSASTLKAVADTGYTEATPIQAQAIPVALAGRDVLGIAQTGTGKTAAFTLPMVDRLANGFAKARMPRALVLAPTRELADQVAESFAKYAKGTKLSWALLIGGVSMGDQVSTLDKGVDVLIATPGRLLDLFDRGKVLLTGVQIMVVDEADRMLDMGFIPDIERIFKLTPPRRQTLFFSATMPPEITRLTTQFLKDPTRIEVARPATTADTITQYVAPIGSADPKAKRTALRMLIERSEIKNAIVFCNRKSEVDIVAKSLKVHGFDAAPIHGDLDQSLRMKTLSDFRSGELKILVASDVAARGLDIPDVSHVFNYDVPHTADDYVHRIGRTGRAGRTGETFMILTPADDRSYDKVLKLIKKTPETLDLELDVSELKSTPRQKEDRKRTRRDNRPRPIAEHGQTASMQPIEAPARSRRKAAEPAPVKVSDPPAVISAQDEAAKAPKADKPSRTRSGRVRKADASEATPPDTATAKATQDEERPLGRGRGRGRAGADVEPARTPGFGDATPAFLLRPALKKEPA